jgi:hypothetical protein
MAENYGDLQKSNNDDCRSKETAIQASGKVVTGKDAANIFVDIFAQVRQIPIPPERAGNKNCPP